MDEIHQPESQVDRSEVERVTYGAKAMRGGTWIAVSAIIVKVASFCSQWALGWLLSENDFALWALALSSSAVVTALRNAGIGRILIQRGDEYSHLARPILTVTLCFNLTLTMLLAAAAIPLARFYNAPNLPLLIWIIAFSFPLSTLSVVLTSKVSIDLRFGDQARIGAISGILRHGSAITFALIGFGPVSFVLPLLLVPIYETIAAYKVVGWIPSGDRPTWKLVREIFTASKWIMLGTAGISIAIMGDYIVIGKLDPRVLGMYFFGFQLADSLTLLFTTPLLAVLLPSLVKIRHDPERLATACKNALRMVSLVAAPFSIGLAAIADPLVHFLWWDGRWNGAIPVVILVSLSVVFRIQRIIGFSVLEAHGKWKSWAVIYVIESLGVLAAAACGASMGGLLSIVIWICAYRVLISIAQCLYMNKECGVTSSDYVNSTVSSFGISLICGVLSHSLFTLIIPVPHAIVRLTAIGITFAALYVCLAIVLMRNDINQLRTIIKVRHPQSID